MGVGGTVARQPRALQEAIEGPVRLGIFAVPQRHYSTASRVSLIQQCSVVVMKACFQVCIVRYFRTVELFVYS